MRKKAALSMDNRYCMMIENAFYIVNPPEAPLEAKTRRPPLQEYIARLLYDDLNRNNAESVLRQIRKLDWENREVSTYAIGCLSAIWNVKFYNIRYAASLLAGLVSHHVSVCCNSTCISNCRTYFFLGMGGPANYRFCP